MVLANFPIGNDIKERIVDLADGNPGATIVCIRLYQAAGPDGLRLLKEAGLRGTKIWGLYVNKCGHDPENGPAILLAELRKMLFESV